jgi:hypothetical protein
MPVSVSVQVAQGTKSYEVLGSVIAEAAPRLNVMYLKIFCTPAALATPAVPLQDFTAELTVGFSVQLRAWPSGSNCSQGPVRTLSRSCSRCGTARPSTSLVRADRRASWLPVSKLTPARKSAQIISRQ